ncbi:MAG: hypothetical protein LLG97_10615 [Deltaproteobacteria bacterium]|nr:hypothetical protein [Deltaproteobacteria bacterium]
MKKIRTWIPVILALAILVGGPFGFGRMDDSDPRGGLICYCCSATGETCAMISCSGCCGAHTSATADRWSPEMTLESSPAFIPATVVYGDLETAQPPETVYLDVPDEPPERA